MGNHIQSVAHPLFFLDLTFSTAVRIMVIQNTLPGIVSVCVGDSQHTSTHKIYLEWHLKMGVFVLRHKVFILYKKTFNTRIQTQYSLTVWNSNSILKPNNHKQIYFNVFFSQFYAFELVRFQHPSLVLSLNCLWAPNDSFMLPSLLEQFPLKVYFIM